MRYNITVTTATDIAQLTIMLIGLLRCRQEKRGFLGYLYIQVGGVAVPCPATDDGHAGIGPGLGMACRRDFSGDSMRGRL